MFKIFSWSWMLQHEYLSKGGIKVTYYQFWCKIFCNFMLTDLLLYPLCIFWGRSTAEMSQMGNPLPTAAETASAFHFSCTSNACWQSCRDNGNVDVILTDRLLDLQWKRENDWHELHQQLQVVEGNWHSWLAAPSRVCVRRNSAEFHHLFRLPGG